jgi:hypothetical protein
VSLCQTLRSAPSKCAPQNEASARSAPRRSAPPGPRDQAWPREDWYFRDGLDAGWRSTEKHRVNEAAQHRAIQLRMIWLQPKVCLTEEGLSQIRAPKRKAGQIRVRARNSIRFKPRAVNPRKCGGERRVRFVLRRGRALLFNIGVTSPKITIRILCTRKTHRSSSQRPARHPARIRLPRSAFEQRRADCERGRYVAACCARYLNFVPPAVG